MNSKDAFFYGYTQKVIGFEYPYKNFSGLFSISNYPASTLIRVNADYLVGFTGAKITRVDLGSYQTQQTLVHQAFCGSRATVCKI